MLEKLASIVLAALLPSVASAQRLPSGVCIIGGDPPFGALFDGYLYCANFAAAGLEKTDDDVGVIARTAIKRCGEFPEAIQIISDKYGCSASETSSQLASLNIKLEPDVEKFVSQLRAEG